MANVLDKARELGMAILDSEEYTALKESEVAIHEDTESYRLFRDMDKSEKDRMEALKDEKVACYIECQGRYNSLMKDINTIISYYTGYIAEKGDCGSCSGCGSK